VRWLQAAKIKLSISHVPKTIFNDLPLGSARTFGFNTARQVGHTLVQMFAVDAATSTCAASLCRCLSLIHGLMD
jgi:6-phosphofructokinase